MIEQRIIDGLSTSDNNVVEELYDGYRSKFLLLGQSYRLTEAESLDIFHDSLIILRNHAMKGNLGKVRYQLSTYFMAIGKYRLYEYLKKRQLDPLSLVSEIPDVIDDADHVLDDEISQKQSMIIKALDTIGPACRKLLTFFYFEGLSIDEIVHVGNYDNANVVRAQKSRCLKQLNERIHGKRSSN
jgi:RNA polymerase sigma factor (sigma-70 family)